MKSALGRVFQKFLRYAAGAIGVFALYVAVDGALDIYFGNRSVSWPTTTAVVTKSSTWVESRQVAVGGGRQRGIGRVETRYTHHFIFRYKYSVAGVEYEGSRITYHVAPGDQPPFSWNDKITVRFDPAQPSRSVLFPGVARGNWVMLWLWSSLTFACAYLATFGGKHVVQLLGWIKPKRRRSRGFEPVMRDDRPR